MLAEVGWDKLKAELARRRANGEMVGAGLAMFVEKSGLGPSDGVRIEVDTSGMVEVITGGASIGQGFETVMAQVCAEGIGVDYKRMRVIHGQTDRIEFGIGAHASRATVMTASATHIARAQGAREGARHRRRADAGGARRARHRRRQGGPQGPARGPLDDARRDRRASGADLEDPWANASRGSRPKAGSTPSIRSTPTASTSRW